MELDGLTDAKPAMAERGIGMQKRMVILILVVSALLSGFYLWFSWDRYHGVAKSEAVMLAKSLSAMLHAEQVAALSGGPEDLDRADYILIKSSLMKLKETANPIYFSYLLGLQNESVVILVDSEPADSPDYSPPGQIFFEASAEVFVPFRSGQTVLTKPTTDRWGSWISVLVPLIDSGSQKVTAIFGVDYSAAEWFSGIWAQMIPELIIAAGFLLLCLLLLAVWEKNSSLKRLSKRLAMDEALFHNVFNQAPLGIAIVSDRKFVPIHEFAAMSLNPMFKRILQRDANELTRVEWPEITHPDDLQKDLDLFRQFQRGEIDGYNLEKRFLLPDGSPVWTNMHISRFAGNPDMGIAHLCLLEDISSRKQIEEILRESERSKAVLLSHLPGMAYRCLNDNSWTMEFVSEGCLAVTGYAPESIIGNRDVSYNDIISHEYREIVREEWDRALNLRSDYRGEYEIITKSGGRKWVLELAQGVFSDAGGVQALEGIIVDVTEQKMRDAQITYLSGHDLLTGLLNRRAFEEKKEELNQSVYFPLSVVICDIDGFRLINDAFGYEQGDRLLCSIASVILDCCRKEDVVSRTGGDEFTILMPHTNSNQASDFQNKLEHTVECYKRADKNSLFEVSLSISHSTKDSENQSMDDVLKNARDYLIHRKLLSQASSHNAILSSIMATMYARSQETEEHGVRLARITRAIGEKIGLKQERLDNLELLSVLHDIGKIGIDDRILNKPGKLAADEWELMKRHTEIGYRIAKSSPEFEHIADFILHHHERWDGTGYPNALKGSEIPMESRIIAIADAYDAMTHNRGYHQAIPYEAAVDEIKRYAGTQFDPDIARLFIELLPSLENIDDKHGLM